MAKLTFKFHDLSEDELEYFKEVELTFGNVSGDLLNNYLEYYASFLHALSFNYIDHLEAVKISDLKDKRKRTK